MNKEQEIPGLIRINSSCPRCAQEHEYAYPDFTVLCDLCECEYYLDDWDD